MVHMAHRTTVLLSTEDAAAIKRAAKAEGISQSQLIRKGIRTVTAPYIFRAKPLVGWLRLSKQDLGRIERDEINDYDAIEE